MSAGAALVGVLCVGLDCHSMQGGKYFYCYMVQAEAMNTPPPEPPSRSLMWLMGLLCICAIHL
jgi:hypothetical protein